jgi:hypothetical protein
MTNVQNIQRPQLFENFFHLLITWSNEVIDYLNTTIQEKKADVTPRRLKASMPSNNTKNYMKLTPNLINYELASVALSIQNIKEELTFENSSPKKYRDFVRIERLSKMLSTAEKKQADLLDLKRLSS